MPGAREGMPFTSCSSWATVTSRRSFIEPIRSRNTAGGTVERMAVIPVLRGPSLAVKLLNRARISDVGLGADMGISNRKVRPEQKPSDSPANVRAKRPNKATNKATGSKKKSKMEVGARPKAAGKRSGESKPEAEPSSGECLVGLAACKDWGMNSGDAMAITGINSRTGKPAVWTSAAYSETGQRDLDDDDPLEAVKEHLDYYARPQSHSDSDEVPDFEVRVARVHGNFEELVAASGSINLKWFKKKHLLVSESVVNQLEE